jgi:ribosome-binding protein aMBF1 (putative translation factor)
MKAYTDRERVCLALVSEGVAIWKKNGWSVKDLAKSCNLSVATIERLASGRTVWPQFHTVIAVLEAMSIHLLVDDKRN